MIRLIVNADDCGMSLAIDEGIFRAAADGIVRSTSLVANGRTFMPAARRLRAAGIGVGVHLALCGGFMPVSRPEDVPTLLERRRLRRSWTAFVRDSFAGRVCLDEVERELDAQVLRATAAGLPIDHLDGHQHLHVLPGVLQRVVAVGERHGIRAMRLPAEAMGESASLSREVKRSLISALSMGARHQLPGWMRTPGSFHGVAGGGMLDRAALLQLLSGLGEGTHEIGCHPGARDDRVPEDPSWRYAWVRELAALTDPDVRAMVQQRGIELIRFSDL